MKRLRGLILAFLLLLTLLPWQECAAADIRSGFYGEHIRWELDRDNGILTLTGTGDMEKPNEDIWAWAYYRKDVRYVVIEPGITGVSRGAFSDFENLVEVSLPQGLEVIGEDAFSGCGQLAKINFPSSLTAIRVRAFYCCVSLEEAVFSKNLVSIGTEAFYGCRGLKTLEMPGVTSLGNGAFSGCVALEEVSLPEGLTMLPSRTFENCTSLKTVQIPESVQTIAADAFLGCILLETDDDRLDVEPGNISTSWDGKSGSYGDNIRWELNTSTGLMTLSGTGEMEQLESPPWWQLRQYIRKVVIEPGITTVGKDAFWHCENLSEVILPEGLEVIGEGAFFYCHQLAKINFPDSLYAVRSEAFYCCVSLEEAVFSDNLYYIGPSAFFGCRALKTLEMPGVTNFGVAAFSGCVALKEVRIPEGTTLIPSLLFRDCTALKTVVIPDSVTSVVSDAFQGCDALGTVSLPENINIIGEQEATAPEQDTIPGWEIASQEAVTWAFDAETGTLIVSGNGDMFGYPRADQYPWYPYRDQIRHLVVESGVTGIDTQAFCGYEKLETVKLCYGLQSIETGAFRGCTALREVELPDSAEDLSRNIFWGCTALTKLVLPREITSLPAGLCYGCTSLESIELPPLLWKIGDEAFYGCEKLSDVELPNDYVQIDSSVFARCPIPAQVRWYVFLQNYGVVIPMSVMLAAIIAVLVVVLWCQAKGGRKRLLGRAAAVCSLTAATLVCAIAAVLMDLQDVTKEFGSPLMWLPSLLPEPWNEIVVAYFQQLLQWFYVAVVVFGIAVHQWFCTGEALRSSGELPRGAGFARTGVLAGSFGALALWCYLTWRGRQEGWASYEEMSVLFPLGILCGLAAVLLPGWKRGRELISRYRGIAVLGAGIIVCIWLLAPVSGILEKYGIFIMEVWRMGWDIALLILAVACGAFAVYCLVRAVYNGWKYRDREEGTVDWGRIARIGIIVAAVVIGYMIFCVLARGNVKSEYFAEQITVTHVYEDSEDRVVYCVDFVREELQFYTEDADGNRELHWTKPLTTEALDTFVETCNREELLGGEYDPFYSANSTWRRPDVPCYVMTYSVKGEREVFSNTHRYLDADLPVKLNQAFYELTGIYCLDTP